MNPTAESGSWKIDLPALEEFISASLVDKAFGGVVETFYFRFEIGEFEKWSEWFSSDGNSVRYSPKSKYLASVGQLHWREIKELNSLEQLERLKLAIARSITNVQSMKRKPKGFDVAEFMQAVNAALTAVDLKKVEAKSAV